MSSTLDELRLDGQVALVTGGSRSLGKAMARALADAGADVAICSRHKDECVATARELAEQTGRTVVPHEVDVVQTALLEAMVADTMTRFGRIDILINNAGVGLRRPMLRLGDDDWQQVLDIDLTAPFKLSRAVVPHMIARHYGRIINISSALGQVAFPGRGPYCAAKGGLNMLTKVMALEWAEHGITANAICPGPFDTPGNQVLKDDPVAYAHYLSIIPERRWAQPREIGALALYLASPASAFVTGSLFTIDGGWTAH